MASHFQNRLVGISILVASVVIFLPSIIDGKKMAYEDEFVATPLHPEAKLHLQQIITPQIAVDKVNKQASEPIQQQLAEQNPITQQSVADDDWQVIEVAQKAPVAQPTKIDKPVSTQAIKVAVAKVPAKKKTMPSRAWTIQLGAFKNLTNINSLLKTLHKAGFQAHTVPAEVIDGELTRLFVGPDVSKEKLEKQLPRLKRLTKLAGKLIPFDAVNP